MWLVTSMWPSLYIILEGGGGRKRLKWKECIPNIFFSTNSCALSEVNNKVFKKYSIEGTGPLVLMLWWWFVEVYMKEKKILGQVTWSFFPFSILAVAYRLLCAFKPSIYFRRWFKLQLTSCYFIYNESVNYWLLLGDENDVFKLL